MVIDILILPFVVIDAHLVHSLETKYPRIIYDRTEISELMQLFFIISVCFNNFRYDSHGKLSCKTEFLPYILIDYPLEKDLVEKFFIRCYSGNIVAGRI